MKIKLKWNEEDWGRKMGELGSGNDIPHLKNEAEKKIQEEWARSGRTHWYLFKFEIVRETTNMEDCFVSIVKKKKERWAVIESLRFRKPAMSNAVVQNQETVYDSGHKRPLATLYSC